MRTEIEKKNGKITVINVIHLLYISAAFSVLREDLALNFIQK